MGDEETGFELEDEAQEVSAPVLTECDDIIASEGGLDEVGCEAVDSPAS